MLCIFLNCDIFFAKHTHLQYAGDLRIIKMIYCAFGMFLQRGESGGGGERASEVAHARKSKPASVRTRERKIERTSAHVHKRYTYTYIDT